MIIEATWLESDKVLPANLDRFPATMKQDLFTSKPYVYRIVGNHLKRQTIEFSLQNLTRVEITSGLSLGDQVALPAEDKPMLDGGAVKVVP